MDVICGKINKDLLLDCNSKFTGGMEQKIVLVNRQDIDNATTVISDSIDPNTGDCSHKVTHLQLKSGSTGYVVTSLPSKKLMNAGFNLIKNEDSRDGYEHFIEFKAFGLNEEVLCFLKSLSNGASLVAIVENKDKGTDGDSAYSIYGMTKGMGVIDINYNSKESKGGIFINLKTQDGEIEAGPPYSYLDTDYPTTQTAFDNKFAQS